LVGGSSLPLNNVTNQIRNQGSSLAQQSPNSGGAAPLQQQPLQQQPLTPAVQQQQPFAQSQPQVAIPSPPSSLQIPFAPLPTNPYFHSI
jgi:hypothetical protein